MKAIFPNLKTKDIDLMHIADRFMIHFFSSGGVCLLVLFAASFLTGLFPERDWTFYVVPNLVAFMAIKSREIWDVRNGNPITKSVIDWISWALGLLFYTWLAMRLGV